MARKITQKQLKHDEFIDAAFDFGHWLEEHWSSVLKGLGAALVLVLAVTGWMAWSRHSSNRATRMLAVGIDRYEEAETGGFVDQESLNSALETFRNASNTGAAGPLARFYLGATLFRLDRLDEAKVELEGVASRVGPDDTLGATAQLMLARVEHAAGRTDAAVTLLEALAGQPDAAVPPAQVLLELGRLHRTEGRDDEARRQWQRIVDEYPDSPVAAEARSLL